MRNSSVLVISDQSWSMVFVNVKHDLLRSGLIMQLAAGTTKKIVFIHPFGCYVLVRPSMNIYTSTTKTVE
jgi:hypothetical protein